MWFWQKNKKKRVFVGLSGGVDSAVSAALLLEAGYDVTGVFIRIAIPGYPCQAGVDKISAMRVAAHLSIPFKEIDLSSTYKEGVFDTTISEFEIGRTPNPDTLCNKEVKFGAFYQFARESGAEYIATGHYAQNKQGRLYAGKDHNKDQSYFLWMIPKNALTHTLFPIGTLTKPQVRTLAAKYGLPNAARKDSQGLCFLGDISIADMLHKELEVQPGHVLNEVGEVVGSHEGAPLYTLGQRHGFALTTHTPDTPAHFVVATNVAENTITVSTNKYPLGSSKTIVTLTQENWLTEDLSGNITARFRYRQTLIPATLVRTAGRVTPHHVPLGQSLVIYRDEECLGGGVVDKSTLH